jgi:hypothetical protein
MAASTAMGKQCAGVFSDIAALGDRLKTIIHDSVLFQVENGIDYIFSSKLNTQLIAAIDTAGRNSVSSSSSTMAGDLFQNAKSAVKEMSTEMGKCKQAFDTSDADGWTPELETKFFVLWKGLAFKISRLSLLVLERAVDVRLLLGGTSDNVSEADYSIESTSDNGICREWQIISLRRHQKSAQLRIILREARGPTSPLRSSSDGIGGLELMWPRHLYLPVTIV